MYINRGDVDRLLAKSPLRCGPTDILFPDLAVPGGSLSPAGVGIRRLETDITFESRGCGIGMVSRKNVAVEKGDEGTSRSSRVVGVNPNEEPRFRWVVRILCAGSSAGRLPSRIDSRLNISMDADALRYISVESITELPESNIEVEFDLKPFSSSSCGLRVLRSFLRRRTAKTKATSPTTVPQTAPMIDFVVLKTEQ